MIVIESFEHINIPCTDIKKSIEFYTLFLDFEVEDENEKSAILVFDNLAIRLFISESPAPSYPIATFLLDVDDFTDALQEIEDKGVVIAKGPYEISGGETVIIGDPGGNLIELYYRE